MSNGSFYSVKCDFEQNHNGEFANAERKKDEGPNCRQMILQLHSTLSTISTPAQICTTLKSEKSTDKKKREKVIACFLNFQFFIFLTFSLLYAAYTANIVSLLQSPSKSIRTMEDLYRSKLELYVEDTPYSRVYFSAPDNSPFQKKVIQEKITVPGIKDNFIKVDVGVARVRKGLQAFYGEETAIYRLMEDTFFEHEKCDVVSIDFISLGFPYVAFKRHSPYTEIFRVK